MMQVNVADYGTKLAELVRLLQSGQEDSVVLVKDGKPVARMSNCAEDLPNGGRIKFGIAKGKLNYTGDFDDRPTPGRNSALTPEETAHRVSMKDGRRIGIAEGKLVYPDDIHAFDDEIAELFGIT